MRDVTENPTKSGDDLLVGSMVQHEETVTEGSVVKNPTQTAPKTTKVPRVCQNRIK